MLNIGRYCCFFVYNMEKYENIYKSICRLCLHYRENKKMVSLIDENSQDGLSPYAKAVSFFAKVNIKKEDCFPSNICSQCLYLLKQAIYLKLVTESSDYCLKQLENSIGVDKQNFKEKVIEYTMFKFYFPTEYSKTSHVSSKNKNSSKHINSEVINVENVTKVNENVITSSNTLDNDTFDVPMSESETEQDTTYNRVKVLDKIDNLITSNIFETPITVRKKKRQYYIRKKKFAAKQQRYKLALQQRLRQKNKLKIKSLICNICNKVLANQLTYDHHMQRHNGCRYICEHCGKGFPVLTELQIHQVTRHGTGPHHQCSHCPFKAPRKFDLIEHERIHSGERPYTCDKCGLTFRRRGIWRKHLIYHTEKKIQCPQCPRKFFQRSEMLAHANNIHDRVYVYLCSKCDATYTKTATVRRHMTERHGIPRESQGKVIRINKRASCQEQ